MSDADPETDEQVLPVPTGLDAHDLASIARLTDVLRRNRAAVNNIGGITPTDFGLVFEASIYIQTREPAEGAEPNPEAARPEGAGPVETDLGDEPVAEDDGDDGDDDDDDDE